MGAKSHGPRHRSRSKLKKRARAKGMPSLGNFLVGYKKGQKVIVRPESSVHKGMPPLRFLGKIGTIMEQRGRAYLLKINDGNKEKQLIANPVHLKEAGK